MHRMERRMAVRKRSRNLSNSDQECTEEKTKPLAPKSRRLSVEQMIRKKRVPTSFSVVMSSCMSNDLSYDTHMRTELLYLHNLPEGEKAKPTLNTTAPTADKDVVGSKSARSSARNVPLTSEDQPENIEDDAFIKRHIKQELEEKRRKRWDVQRFRELQQHKSLEERNRMREEARLKGRKSLSKDCTDSEQQTVSPSVEEILAVEVSDTVPVSVFGCPVPLFQSREFDIPWFSLERRELQERALREKPKSTRGRGRVRGCGGRGGRGRRGRGCWIRKML
ncbi:predicted protein [Nematostella vectensis]|uniref:PEHE domain-containing protein n=1 Tax=Nematostella vectensis TaxID=45351 RepID=A7RRX6_NEMVE|nr:predicted protein [Nematostella vectensis]|eukprot:XP_001637966.1 predicted protein [Nematostella vectensis]